MQASNSFVPVELPVHVVKALPSASVVSEGNTIPAFGPDLTLKFTVIPTRALTVPFMTRLTVALSLCGSPTTHVLIAGFSHNFAAFCHWILATLHLLPKHASTLSVPSSVRV